MSTAAPHGAEVVIGADHPALTGRTGLGSSVGIIDSGVHPTHPHVGGLAGGIAIEDDGSLHGDVLDRLGHGTAVTAAIHEKAPRAELYIIRVFHGSLSTNIEALIQALDWAIDRGMRLVNLSLGTANPENAKPLAEAVARAAAAGVTIVSARADGSRIWFPGSLPGVVGVELDWDAPRDQVRIELSGANILARASGYPRPIPGVPPERNLKGVSFAVANTTGLLARFLEGRSGSPVADELLGVSRISEPRAPEPGPTRR